MFCAWLVFFETNFLWYGPSERSAWVAFRHGGVVRQSLGRREKTEREKVSFVLSFGPLGPFLPFSTSKLSATVARP